MSWSAECEIKKGTEPVDIVHQIQTAEVSGNEDCLTERLAASNAAKLAALTVLISDGSTGMGSVREHGYSVRMNGHVNPNHEPRDGWANDFINISINQTSD
jgi:hypothetical protein